MTSSYSLASGSAKAVTGLSVTLAAGTYILTTRVNFTSNATGRRGIAITATTSSPTEDTMQVTQNAVSGTPTRMVNISMQSITAYTTYQVYAYQNSGSTLSIINSSAIYIIKLK